MVSVNTLLNYPDWIIQFTVNDDAHNTQFGAINRQNTKHIALFYRIPIKPQCNHTKNR